jgi:hypothetical protein
MERSRERVDASACISDMCLVEKIILPASTCLETTELSLQMRSSLLPESTNDLRRVRKQNERRIENIHIEPATFSDKVFRFSNFHRSPELQSLHIP